MISLTTDQARRMQSALAQQQTWREALLSAHDDLTVHEATMGYLVATDRCYETACEIKANPA